MAIEIESPEEIGYDTIEYNLAESSVADAILSDLKLPDLNLKLAYTDHRGKKELRQLIAEESNALNAGNVLITAGAAGALFIINTCLLSSSDHLIVLRPNYATNIETPRAIGCEIDYIDLHFETGWRIDFRKIEAAIKSNTKCISITTPHNPTGMLITEKELKDLIVLAEKHDIFILIDETYRNACYLTPYPVTAALSRKIISVNSISKAFGLPGLRIGWLITQNEVLMELFLAAKEMIHITNSALDEEIAYNFLIEREQHLTRINKGASANLEMVKDWLTTEKRLECIMPEGGVVCFPRFTVTIDTAAFYALLLEKYKTLVGPGHWFEMPDTYMRIGFGWVDSQTLFTGLQNITAVIDEISEGCNAS